MRKLLGMSLMVAALCVGGSAFGQSARQIDRHVAEMRKFLHLSGRQAGTIRGDYFAASDEKRLVARNGSLSPFERDRKLREIDRGRNEQIRAVLGPRQIEAWESWRINHERF